MELIRMAGWHTPFLVLCALSTCTNPAGPADDSGMRDAVIVALARTPIGRRHGSLAAVHPVDLGAVVLRALALRAPFDPANVEDVMFGCVSQSGDQAWNVGRNVVLAGRRRCLGLRLTGSVAPVSGDSARGGAGCG